MKLNLSVDEEGFKKQVKDLRQKLNKTQETGILEDDFEKCLEVLSAKEEKLLTEMIPHYRAYAGNSKDAIKTEFITRLGAYGFEGFLQSVLRFSEDMFITGSTDCALRFFQISKRTDPFGKERIQEEWSPPFKDIKERISAFHRLNKNEIMLFGNKGGGYLLSCSNFKQIPNGSGEMHIKKIETETGMSWFGQCLSVSDNLIAAEREQEELVLLEVVKEKEEYRLILHKDASLPISNIIGMEKTGADNFTVGTKTGEIYFIKQIYNNLSIVNKIKIPDCEIRKIHCLKNEKGQKDTLLTIGNNGKLHIISLDGADINILDEGSFLKGNLFDAESSKGTAVILSEDGIIYLLEENFGKWHINKESIMEGAFFTDVLKLYPSKYLLMGVEGELCTLNINRIDTPEALWDLPLYL
ncbi:hypothetical protein [Lacrimispora sp.]|uniref:hypothetical protein n=1 Tax=Lacrimispora sp. TaxID=2719234 RepID=UPI0028AA658D|nr:hypothetical protein [Lacrimispora sp.]